MGRVYHRNSWRPEKKKLIEAAEHWARGGKDDGKAMEDDAALLGIELPEPESEQDDDFLVDEDNWETVIVFCQCATQWNYGAMGGVIGLNYPGVKIVMDVMLPRKRHVGVFEGLQVMERAAMAVLNAKKG